MTAALRSIYDLHGAEWWSRSQMFIRLLYQLVPARLRYFDPLIGDWRGLEVLDLGCGGGFMSEALAGRGARVTALDPATVALRAGVRHAAAGKLAVTYVAGRGEALPFAGRSFDAVVCVDVLEHVEDLPAVVAEAARVLRPGGRFLFETINRNWLARLVMITFAERLLRLLPAGTHDPACFIRPAELAAQLGRHGMRLRHVAGIGPVRPSLRSGLVFGRLPSTAVSYIGHAERTRGRKNPANTTARQKC